MWRFRERLRLSEKCDAAALRCPRWQSGRRSKRKEKHGSGQEAAAHVCLEISTKTVTLWGTRKLAACLAGDAMPCRQSCTPGTGQTIALALETAIPRDRRFISSAVFAAIAQPTRASDKQPPILDNSKETGMAFAGYFCYKQRVQFSPGYSTSLAPNLRPHGDWVMVLVTFKQVRITDWCYAWATVCPISISRYSAAQPWRIKDI